MERDFGLVMCEDRIDVKSKKVIDIGPFVDVDPEESIAVPLYSLPPKDVFSYWEDLKNSARLEMRLCDTSDPDMDDVKRMIEMNGPHMYHVIFPHTSTRTPSHMPSHMSTPIAAEFMLNNFTGKAAQIHFSVHPLLHIRKGLPLVKHIVHSIFTWRVKNSPREAYLDSLYGLTPVTNRAACLYVLKVGFKKRFVLPHGMWDKGKPVDAMVTTFTREDL